jgi:hypothetical protein
MRTAAASPRPVTMPRPRFRELPLQELIKGLQVVQPPILLGTHFAEIPAQIDKADGSLAQGLKHTLVSASIPYVSANAGQVRGKNLTVIVGDAT